MADDWARLIAGASNGDLASVEELLQRHLPAVQAFIRLRMNRRLRAKESASDLAQSVCREVLANLDRFQYPGEDAFRKWLFATAHRVVQNKAKFYGRAKRDIGREATPVSGNDGGLANFYQTLSTPSRQLMQQEQIEAFEVAFDNLPEDHREVISLSRIAGLPHKEVAEQMGRTEAATRSLLFRALAALAAALDRPGDSSSSS